MDPLLHHQAANLFYLAGARHLIAVATPIQLTQAHVWRVPLEEHSHN